MAEQLTPATQSGEFPAQQPAFLGEWQFMTNTAAPPSTGQVRLNNATQTAATLLWVHKVTANGMTADILAQVGIGNIFNMHDKDDGTTKFQNYRVTAAPVDKSTYWEFPVVWISGGSPVLQQRIMFDITGLQVWPAGLAIAASVGSVVIDFTKHTHVSVPVTGLPLSAASGAVAWRLGQAIAATGEPMLAVAGTIKIDALNFLPGYAFPGTSPDGVSLGMTLRQWYAGQAIVGFVSANPAANLIGRLPQFCFRLADSMIAFEAAEAAGFIESPIPTNAPPRGQQTPPTEQAVAPSPTQAVALRQVR